jgi:isopenicillin N synthase-like dioxygenase
MFAAAAAFFSEPLEVKRRLAIGNSPAHRGYVGIGAESLDDTGRGDAKESLDTGGEQGLDHPEVVAGTPLFGPNQWPRTPGFREAWERYFARAVEVAARVQRALAHAPGLTDDDILAPARRRRRRRLQMMTREGTWLGPGEGPRYRPQKAGDYLLSRLDSTHT